ncbi:hypothetical protein OG592_42705 (plasmid) [Streptomyces avidinii]|uniref:hypothetical protein n=1 Tax=Streptomyces avidinii TaxID=1895 RepID=UPI002F9099A6|nr:hypothetical protein OG592_42705 [Streptomyces avidinii]
MALWMAWTVTSVAAAGGKMDDVEGAVAALDRSVQRILDRDPAMTGRPATAPCESARDIRIDAAFEPWRDLITGIRALRLTVYDVADRLRSLHPAS